MPIRLNYPRPLDPHNKCGSAKMLQSDCAGEFKVTKD